MATGAWTSQILRASGLAGPDIRPVKGEMVVLQADPDAMPVTRLVWTDDCYIIPQSEGRVLVGATQVEEGFDLTINAVRVDALKRAAAKAIPALGRLSEVERFCGFRPASVDAQPVVGSAGIPGLTLLTGQFRNGILFAPLLAEAAAHHVLTGALPHGMEAFSAMRFIRNAA
jgi:glycine oxidase